MYTFTEDELQIPFCEILKFNFKDPFLNEITCTNPFR